MDKDKFELSRRKALAGLGTIGVAGAGTGMGTSALFSDEENLEDNTLTAGELNLFVDYYASVDDPTNSSTTDVIDGGDVGNDAQIDGDVAGKYVLNDVKPGDGGDLVFCPKVVDNPSWIYLGSNGVVSKENGLTEPESEVDDSGGDPGTGDGELAEKIEVKLVYCEPKSGVSDPSDPGDFTNFQTIKQDYTLADLLTELEGGVLLDGEPDTADKQAYPASSGPDVQAGPCVRIAWDVPDTVGNVIQSDSVEFDIAFEAEQERNNATPDSPFSATGFSPVATNTDNAGMDLQLIQSGGQGQSGGQVQIHGDAPGVEKQDAFGGGGAPLDTDIEVTAELKANETVLSADDGTNTPEVIDNDPTDGDANGSSTGNAEFPGGVPDEVDVSIGVKTDGPGLTASVENVTINGSAPAGGGSLSASNKREYQVYANRDSEGSGNDTLVVQFTARFEGSQDSPSNQDIIDVHFGDMNA
jgi:predicted ribosomally synthesized peptide with SipW-like signal peptide